jgi:hypothetical protein
MRDGASERPLSRALIVSCGSPHAICMKRVPETIFEFSRGAQVGQERSVDIGT